MATKSEREAWNRMQALLSEAAHTITTLRQQIYQMRHAGDPEDIVHRLKTEALTASEFGVKVNPPEQGNGPDPAVQEPGEQEPKPNTQNVNPSR